jgi:hypothetical protein
MLAITNYSLHSCIKVALLPTSSSSVLACCTKAVEDLKKPFGENFPMPVPVSKLCAKTLQVNVWCIRPDTSEECVVSWLKNIINNS